MLTLNKLFEGSGKPKMMGTRNYILRGNIYSISHSSLKYLLFLFYSTTINTTKEVGKSQIKMSNQNFKKNESYYINFKYKNTS